MNPEIHTIRLPRNQEGQYHRAVFQRKLIRYLLKHSLVRIDIGNGVSLIGTRKRLHSTYEKVLVFVLQKSRKAQPFSDVDSNVYQAIKIYFEQRFKDEGFEVEVNHGQ